MTNRRNSKPIDKLHTILHTIDGLMIKPPLRRNSNKPKHVGYCYGLKIRPSNAAIGIFPANYHRHRIEQALPRQNFKETIENQRFFCITPVSILTQDITWTIQGKK